MSLENDIIDSHRPCLIVHPFVIQISTSAVMVSLLQLQAMSVNSHGEAAIACKRQSRCVIYCQHLAYGFWRFLQLTPQAGILASSCAAFAAAFAAVVSAEDSLLSVCLAAVFAAAVADNAMIANTKKHVWNRDQKYIVVSCCLQTLVWIGCGMG